MNEALKHEIRSRLWQSRVAKAARIANNPAELQALLQTPVHVTQKLGGLYWVSSEVFQVRSAEVYLGSIDQPEVVY